MRLTVRRSPNGTLVVRNERQERVALFPPNKMGTEAYEVFVAGMAAWPTEDIRGGTRSSLFDFDKNEFVVGGK